MAEPGRALIEARRDQMFPTLTPAENRWGSVCETVAAPSRAACRVHGVFVTARLTVLGSPPPGSDCGDRDADDVPNSVTMMHHIDRRRHDSVCSASTHRDREP